MAEVLPSRFKQQYPHPRWMIWAPDPIGAHGFAIAEAAAGLHTLVPYMVEITQAGDPEVPHSEDHILALGTPDDHPLVRRLYESGELPLPDHPQGYALRLAPAEEGKTRQLVIGARTAEGLAHGVAHVNAEWIGHETLLFPRVQGDFPRFLEDRPGRTETGAPAVERRGIWSWGYTVYDYRGFIDTMARLRMNTLFLWNDEPPYNWADIAAHAASRHIELIPGFHWGWGTTLDWSSADLEDRVARHVLEQLRRYPGDTLRGAYFQTQTEHTDDLHDGRPVAEHACRFVNGVARRVLEVYPELRLYFGIHAISVEGHYAAFEKLDPRVSLVWEDAGVIPYNIDPVLTFDETSRGWRPSIDTVDKTIAYSRNVAGLRGAREFMMVAKGFPNLCWNSFENHRGFWLGDTMPASRLRARAAKMAPGWNRSDALWLKNFGAAARFFREVLTTGAARTLVACLVEDALLEHKIHDSLALMAAILWDPARPTDEYYRYVANDYFAQQAR